MSASYRKNFAQSTLPLIYDDFMEEIARAKNPFMELTKGFDYEQYRPLLERVMLKESGKKRKSQAGRRAFDPVFMLVLCLLQTRCGYSDEKFAMALLADRRFELALGVQSPKDLPNKKTLWKYRNIFTKHHIFEQVFDIDLEAMRNLVPELGEKAVIVDSTFQVAPRQRNTREENQEIKKGNGDKLWTDKPHKKCHKDIDARWTKKNNETFYGYKMHCTVCAISKLIVDMYSTDASVHDAKAVSVLIDNLPENPAIDPDKPFQPGAPLFFADAGYIGGSIEKAIKAKGWNPMICQKGFKNNPLTEEQKQDNRRLSSVRSRVEHGFGFIEQSMGGCKTRAVGALRARELGFLMAVVYNKCRLLQLLHRDSVANCDDYSEDQADLVA